MRRLIVSAVLVVLAGCGKSQFPSTFLWGAAVAGFQVDMGCPTLPASQCDDPNSDWYQLVTNKAALPDLADKVNFEPLSHSPGHWELYAQDHARAKAELGLNAFRMSLEWSRIFPTATDGAEGYEALLAIANPEAIATYHAMFASLKKQGLTPMVTLNHYTLPLWVHDGVACHQNLATCTKRGWLDRERTVKEIAKYAGFVAKEFGGEVDLWATENEPFAVVLPGYLQPSTARVNPPALQFKFAEMKQAMVAMIEGHARMYDAVKANDTVDADGNGKAAEVGLVYAVVPIHPKTSSAVDQKGADNAFYLYNTVFLDAVCKGDLDDELTGRPTHRDDLAGRMDWLGLNYYTSISVVGVEAAQLPELSRLTFFDLTNLDTTFVDEPRGLYDMAMHVKTRYGLPSYVTENGTSELADPDYPSSWLVRHVTWMSRAIRDGADVRGYFYWSLIDNYEWNHGTEMKFGIYGVDPTDATKARTARPLVDTYAKVIAEKGVPKALDQKYPAPE